MNFSEEIITSSQNKYVSEARMLEEKKRREASQLFRFDGVKLFCEAQKRGLDLQYILVSADKLENVFLKCEQTYGISRQDINCRIVTVRDDIFEKISQEKSPEGVITVAKYIDKFHKFVKINNEGNNSSLDISPDDKIFLLESVRDPQNVGAIIRSAAAMGADRIIMSDDCADIYNPKTVRAAMGSLFCMKIDRVNSMTGAISHLRASGRRVYCAALDENAQRLGEMQVNKSDCVLVGNEGHGVSREVLKACTGSIYIPMCMEVESLNAAVAASVLLWEFFGRK